MDKQLSNKARYCNSCGKVTGGSGKYIYCEQCDYERLHEPPIALTYNPRGSLPNVRDISHYIKREQLECVAQYNAVQVYRYPDNNHYAGRLAIVFDERLLIVNEKTLVEMIDSLLPFPLEAYRYAKVMNTLGMPYEN